MIYVGYAVIVPVSGKSGGGEIEEEGSNYTSTNSETPNSKVRKCLYR